ncbi:MAG TPA: hypothetical protein PLL09_16340 [Flavobacterium sp.]|uniref:hypothetical protein n=1 Tax=unclassified Flavobacterium TaxID=196869 RepID=UPI0025B84FF5|nr:MULTISPECIES: hypothetical protein [unclassified Flavobacterium]HRE79387.1 hypothetical protein [Flavobacterium sp.]
MKSNYIFLILFMNLIGYSQTAKEQRDPLYQNDYESELVYENSSIIISKYKSSTINEISLVLKTEAKKCPDSNGIHLTLSDGEVLKFDNLEINCTTLEAGRFNLMGSIILTPELYKKLSESEINEFRLGNQKVPVVYKEKEESLKGLFKFSESF